MLLLVMMKCFLWTWTRPNMSRVHKHELMSHPAQLWLNLNPRNVFLEILKIFSCWWWSLLSTGPDHMSSSVTGVNCPSCSLPYDRWEEAHQYLRVSDKTRHETLTLFQISEALSDWLLRPWEMLQLHFLVPDPDLSPLPPESDRWVGNTGCPKKNAI